MQCKVMHHIFDSFYSILKKWSKLGQKTDFLAHFYALLCLIIYAPIFCQIKGLMKVHNRGKFHQYSICGCQVMNFQMFSQQQKLPLQAASGWFSGHNSPKCSQILLKFGTECIIYVTVFLYSPENSKKLSQKTDFLALFQRFLIYALLHPKSYAPVFCQVKGLMKIHNHDKFHWCGFCDCQVINF